MTIRFLPHNAPEIYFRLSQAPSEVEEAWLRLFDGPPPEDGEPYLAEDGSLPEGARILLVKNYRRVLRKRYGRRRNYYQLYRN